MRIIRFIQIAYYVVVLSFYKLQKRNSNYIANKLLIFLEKLGPVFIKFGQMLSTRPDLIPECYVKELSKLQSRITNYKKINIFNLVEQELNKSWIQIFQQISVEPIAVASIAQVHQAKLITGEEVAIKVIRANIRKVITTDIKLLSIFAYLLHFLYKSMSRLCLPQIIKNFANNLDLELNLLAEGANCSQLQFLHDKDNRIIFPRIYFEHSTTNMLVMQLMDGIPINDVENLKKYNVNLPNLAKIGVEIFYTQVFYFGFFHADMHPGNIWCNQYGQYVALDFGIIGYLSDIDKRYLAVNFLAFFNRDYKKVAITHIEAGWVPANTKVHELEQAIATVCEPIFNKPLSQISFAQILLRLFHISKQFNIYIQPQLVLLQKTIINIEGLGLILDPNLNLCDSAKPILHKWIKEQLGWRGMYKILEQELSYLSLHLPKISNILLQNKNTNPVITYKKSFFEIFNSITLIIILLILIYRWW